MWKNFVIRTNNISHHYTEWDFNLIEKTFEWKLVMSFNNGEQFWFRTDDLDNDYYMDYKIYPNDMFRLIDQLEIGNDSIISVMTMD
jgi:hypothetical protein